MYIESARVKILFLRMDITPVAVSNTTAKCGAHGVLEPSRAYTQEQREQIIQDYYERSSMWGVQRVFGVSRPTLSKWLKKDESNPQLKETLLPAQPSDELDEMWSVVECAAAQTLSKMARTVWSNSNITAKTAARVGFSSRSDRQKLKSQSFCVPIKSE